MLKTITNFIKVHKVLLTVSFLLILGFLELNAYLLSIFYKKQETELLGIADNTYQIVLNFRIKSVSKDKINYYISYSYETKGKTELDENIYHEELLTVSQHLLANSNTDLGTYVASTLKQTLVGVSVNSNLTEESIKQQVDYVIAHPEEQIRDDHYVPPSNPPPSNGGTGSNSGGEVFQPEVTNVPPIVPPVLYDTSGPAPIDYYPLPNDPPLPN